MRPLVLLGSICALLLGRLAEQHMKSFIESFRALSHASRAVFFFIGFLVIFCFWLALLLKVGAVHQETRSSVAALYLLAPLVPAALFDLWLRISWHPRHANQYPPPPAASLWARLLCRDYGVFWPPVLICPPIWLTVASLLIYLAWFSLTQ
jgi:hypothetical protein